MPCACAEFSRQITPGRREMLGGLFRAVFLSSPFFLAFLYFILPRQAVFLPWHGQRGPWGFFPPPPPFGLNINFSTIGPGGYFWPRSQPAAFDVHSPGPREVPGFSPRAAGAAGTLPGAGAGRAGGPQAGPGPSPLLRGWILSGPCGVPNDGINWGQGLQPSTSPCPVPMGTGFCVVGRCPAQGETCPGGMPIRGGAPVPVGNPSRGVLFPVDAHPEGMPTPTGCLSLGKTDPKGIPPLVLGGKPAPGGCPPRRMPVPAGYPCCSGPASHGAAPHLCHLFSHSSCSQAPRRAVGPGAGPVAGAGPHGPGPGNLRALPGPPPPPEPRGAVSPGQER